MVDFWRRLLGRSAVTDRFVLEDVYDQTPAPDPMIAIRRIVAEAVILQDEAEAVLRAVGAREPLGMVAPRAGPLVRRFFALEDQLPAQAGDSDAARQGAEVAAILHHHALALSVAMEFLALEWRSPAVAGQLDKLADLGKPGQRLDEIYALLTKGSCRAGG